MKKLYIKNLFRPVSGVSPAEFSVDESLHSVSGLQSILRKIAPKKRPVPAEKEKDAGIETLRGLAIALVVAGYVVRADITRDLHSSLEGSLLRFFQYCLSPLRMPLFAVISGYFYGALPATWESFQKLLQGKSRRLLIPLAACCALQTFLLSLPPFSMDEWPGILQLYIWPPHQFWFLLATFLIYIGMGILDVCKCMDRPMKWMAVLGIALAYHIGVEVHSKFLAVQGINLLLPFLILGYGLRRYPEVFFSKRRVWALLAVYTVCFLFQPVVYWKNLPIGFHGYRALGALISLSGVPLLFYFRRRVGALHWLGRYAFGIYLFYVLGVAVLREVFQSWGIAATMPVFIGLWAGGLFLPILFQTQLEKFSFTRRFVLGLKA